MLKLLMMLFALTCALPITYLTASLCEISYLLLMLLLYISVLIIFTADIVIQKKKVLTCFIIRVIIGLMIGFVIFSGESIITSIILSLFVTILLSILSFAISEKFFYIGVFCFVMFAFNLITVFLNNIHSFEMIDNQVFGILVIISTVAALAVYLTFNMDNARWFGTESLKIPGSMKRSSFLLLIVVCLLITVVAFSQWIMDTIRLIFGTVLNLIGSLFSLLKIDWHIDGTYMDPLPPMTDIPSFIEDIVELEDPVAVNPVLLWIFAGFIIAAVLFMITFILVLFIRFLLRVFKDKQKGTTTGNEVYSEIIEKISPKNKIRKKRVKVGGVRYSSLLTDRERVMYIYHKYVKRAENNGYTYNSFSETPSEILDEITQKAEESKFPLPGSLSVLFNSAKYGNNLNFTADTNALKKRLLHARGDSNARPPA